MILTFQKEETGWYIVLPTWTGDKSELAMVAGADTLLDKLNNENKVIKLKVSGKNDFFGSTGVLTLSKNMKKSGADYIYNDKSINNHKLWLCPVTLFVFDCYPDIIYTKIL